MLSAVLDLAASSAGFGLASLLNQFCPPFLFLL